MTEVTSLCGINQQPQVEVIDTTALSGLKDQLLTAKSQMQRHILLRQLHPRPRK
jgi:hypothetical protein